ncbi:MAG: RNA polymerase factor sigma-54 [Candidatus Eisenbacteria sp.]|nr:RNA polymerase factor sigma-54 [Candidatus Eisenbacteria bacterium]
MKTSMNIELRTQLQLQIRPQMVMTMNLLTLPILDFNQEIETMAEENPVLDVTNPSEISATDAISERKEESSKETTNDEWDERVLQRIAELGEDPNQGGGSWAGTNRPRDEEWTDPILRLAPSKTLRDDLLEQVRLTLSGNEEKIGEFIVQDLDSRGFLTRSVTELAPDIAAYIEDSVTEEEVTHVLERLKEAIEPPGICAANLSESIAIQLKRQGQEKWTDLLITGYELLSAGKERELARLCSKYKVDTSFVFDRLSKLHFVPTFGIAEESFDTNSMRPEVLVIPAHPEIHGPGRYEIRYNSSAIVRLTLNPKIIEMARRRDTLTPAERRFLSEKVQQAKWLRQVVEDRRSLLLRTVEAVVERQWDFLDRGIRKLRPLTQREIAEEVGRDESTISRLINGRFADTPQGCIPLSAFFSQAVGKSSGAAAREALREIMTTEKDGVGYTDDELAERMRLSGYAVHRRTVNKYRRMLGGYFALKRSVRRAMNRREKRVEDRAEEPVEKPTEEPAEKRAEDPVGRPAEEPVEKPTEKLLEEPVE